MKNNYFKKTALLALAGAALLAQPSKAAITSYTEGDLFIGFRAISGTGVTSDYLLDIGQPSQFLTTTNTFTLSLGSFGIDLNATFGPTWFADGHVQWAVVGAYVAGAQADTVWASNTSSTPYNRQFGQGGFDGNINSVGSAYGGNFSTANSNGQGLVQTNVSADPLTYAANFPGGANNYGSAFDSGYANMEASPNTALKLDKMIDGATSAGQLLGTFTIASTGSNNATATYTGVAAIPEPSTYAMLGLGAAFVVFAVRRQRTLQAN